MNEMERLTERDGYIDAVYVKDHDYVEAAHKLADYEDIGTVEEFAAYKQTVDYAKAKVKEIQDRIDARAGDNYHDETKRTLILEERQGAYITILEAAEAALAAKEGERE